MAAVADWQSFAESEAEQRYPNDFQNSIGS